MLVVATFRYLVTIFEKLVTFFYLELHTLSHFLKNLPTVLKGQSANATTESLSVLVRVAPQWSKRLAEP